MKTHLRSILNPRMMSLLVLTAAFTFLNSSCKKDNVEAANETAEDRALVASNDLEMATLQSGSVGEVSPPSSISALYSAVLDTAVSDDFNGDAIDFTKWQYRTDGTSEWGTTNSDVYIAQTGADRFVSIKGSLSPLRGSGISTKALTKYGFFITRWKVHGWVDGGASGWHPAIWG